jgi:hypothetical protein
MGKESFQTSTGLIDDVDIEVVGAHFGINPDYNPDTLLLIWECTTDDPDVPEVDLSFSLGAGWETFDGGKTATHERGKTKFSRRSHYGMVIDRCVKQFGMEDFLGDRGDSWEADIWVGLRFHMERESVDYGDDIGKKEKALPTAYLGVAGETKPQQEMGQTGQKTGAPTFDGLDRLTASVTVMAKKAADHNSFIDAVMDKYPQIAEDDAYEELYTDILDPGGIFAKAK